MNSQDYWRKREEQWIQQQMHHDQDRTQEIAQRYQQALDNIEKEIQANWSNFMGKENISLSEAKQRASEMDIKAFARKAKQYVKEKNFSKTANEELRIYNLTMRVNRLELLKSQIGLELVALSDDLTKYMSDTLNEVGLEEAQRQAGILGETVFDNYQIFVESVVNSSFNSDSTTFSDRIWSSNAALKAELDKLLVRSLTQGKNPREMARELRDRFDATRYESERLMRTETARVQTEVQAESYQQYDIDRYTFIAEPSACKLCKPLDGQVFLVSEMTYGKNAAPMHPNCRCSTAPYMDRAELENQLEDQTIRGPVTPKKFMGSENEEEYRKWYKPFADSLTKEELHAINSYISSDSYKLNDLLRRNSQLSPEFERLKLNLLSAMRKLPKYQGSTQRSVVIWDQADFVNFISAHEIGSVQQYPQFTSTAANVYNNSDDARFIISSKTAADLRYFNWNEQELIYRPDQKFVVTDRYLKNGKPYIEMREFDE